MTSQDRRDIDQNTRDIEAGRVKHHEDNQTSVTGLASLTGRVWPRVNTMQWKLNVLATFLIIMLLVIAGLLQRQAGDLREALNDQCQQRTANAVKARDYYDKLIAIEKRDRGIAPAISAERIAAFEGVKPNIPVCPQ